MLDEGGVPEAGRQTLPPHSAVPLKHRPVTGLISFSVCAVVGAQQQQQHTAPLESADAGTQVVSTPCRVGSSRGKKVKPQTEENQNHTLAAVGNCTHTRTLFSHFTCPHSLTCFRLQNQVHAKLHHDHLNAKDKKWAKTSEHRQKSSSSRKKENFADGSVQAGSRGQLGNRPKGLLLGLCLLTSARRSFHYWPIYFCWLFFWKIKSFHRDEFERTGSTAERLSG